MMMLSRIFQESSSGTSTQRLVLSPTSSAKGRYLEVIVFNASGGEGGGLCLLIKNNCAVSTQQISRRYEISSAKSASAKSHRPIRGRSCTTSEMIRMLVRSAFHKTVGASDIPSRYTWGALKNFTDNKKRLDRYHQGLRKLSELREHKQERERNCSDHWFHAGHFRRIVRPLTTWQARSLC
jgi:hypothetical protein